MYKQSVDEHERKGRTLRNENEDAGVGNSGFGEEVPIGKARSLRVCVLVAICGCATLILEIALIHGLGQLLGATALGAAATSGAFLCSMGLGALAAGRLSPRIERPGKIAAFIELLAGAWSVAAIWGLPLVAHLADRVPLQLDGSMSQVSVNYGISFTLLLVPGALAGALIPLLAPLISEGTRQGRSVARLWVWDSLAAAAGAAFAGLWLLPALGASACLWISAGLHLLGVGLAASFMNAQVSAHDSGEPDASSRLRHRKGIRATTRRKGKAASKDQVPSNLGAIVMGSLFVAGVAGVGWQVAWARLLVLTLPGSLAAPAVMIACWIGGGGLGAWIYRSWMDVERFPGRALGLGQAACAAFALLGASCGSWLAGSLAAARPLSVVLPEVAVAIVVALPAAIAMGVALPAAIDLLAPAKRPIAQLTGAALAADVMGAACGAFFIPFLVIPSLGLWKAMLALALFQAIIGFLLAFATGRGSSWRAPATVGALLVLAVLAGRSSSFGPVPLVTDSGEERAEPVRVVWGPAAVAATVRDADGMRQLFVDRHHGMGGERGLFIERRQGHLPLILHGGARSVAVLGVGTGNTLGAVTRHPLERIDAAESLGSVLRMLDLFGESNRRVWRDERVRIHQLDGHTMLRRSSERYDVIVNDLVHPWRAGAQGLYSLDNFRMIRRSLAPEGVFFLWLPLHELSSEDLSVVAATFLEAFGEGTVLLGHLGWRQPIMAMAYGVRSDALQRSQLLATTGVTPPDWLVEADLDQPEDVQALYLGQRELLEDLAGDASPTSWDRPDLAYRSAATWWRGTSGLGQRTLGYVLSERGHIEEVAPDDGIAARRFSAVGIFLDAELHEAAGELEEAALGYGEAAREDPTFGLPRLALALLRQRLAD